MRRGEVWWAELPAPSGKRPVVLLSRNEAYGVRELVTVAPVTTRIRRIASEVPLGPEDGLPKRYVANLDTITTIPKRALISRVAPLPRDKVSAVDQALKFALGLRN
jgi:mRNA interferase MazF